ncbi:MAG: restriction endonuclease subunit S [Phycisphaerae bacterium]|nr:restriction endonuclease subunit S [Phycisphaerae bacterium]
MTSPSQIPGDPVPRHWKTLTIGELATRVGSGITPTGGSEVYCDEGVTFIRSQNVTSQGMKLHDVAFIDEKVHESMKASEVFPFDVLINITGASIGRCCFLPKGLGPCNVNQHVCAIRLPNANPHDAKYLSVVLSSFIGQSQVFRLNAGGNREGLNFQQLRSFAVPWPAGEERRGIARILTTVDELIEKTEALIAKYEAVKQGVMHDLFTRGVDKQGRLRPTYDEAPHLYKESKLGWIPKEWSCGFLAELISLPQGQIDPRQAPYKDWILVAPDHIEKRTGRLIARHTAAEQNAISGKYVFCPGNVVYSKIRPYLRKAILATEEGICSADMYPMRVADELRPRYLLAVILGESFSRFAESVSERSGFPKLNRSELAEYRTGYPQVEEQGRICMVLEEWDRRIEAEGRMLAKYRLLKAGLMQDLLTGKVPVKVDESEGVPARV